VVVRGADRRRRRRPHLLLAVLPLLERMGLPPAN
jgi:hypothetical protein